MVIDFGKLPKPKSSQVHKDPKEIFKQRPAGDQAANDLWQGQAAALDQWFESHKSNVLINLNTGAGKTYVGLLIAQSLLNSGSSNVVYVCSTIDLVMQTAREPDRLGLTYTLRSKGDFSNDLFAQGRGFCITVYHTITNAKSVFSGQWRPEAIIFDDAHVAQRVVRDAYTIRIEKRRHASPRSSNN